MKSIKLPGFADPVALDHIVWLESEATYTRIHFQNGKSCLVTKPLNYFAQYADLIRVHRSSMVNFMYVQRLAKANGRSTNLELSTGTSLPVARSYLSLITNWLISAPR